MATRSRPSKASPPMARRLHPMQEAFREQPRIAVWLLHPRHDHDRGRHGAPQGPRSQRAHHSRRAGRQSVPLHRLTRISLRRSRLAPRRWRIPISRKPIAKSSHRRFSKDPLCTNSNYHRPATVRQAAHLLAKNEDAKLIAGGHTLVPVMKQRLASPPHLVDLFPYRGARRDSK